MTRRMGSVGFAVLAFLACADKKPPAFESAALQETVSVEDPEVMVLNVQRYDYPMDQVDWLKFGLRPTLRPTSR